MSHANCLVWQAIGFVHSIFRNINSKSKMNCWQWKNKYTFENDAGFVCESNEKGTDFIF